MLEFLLRLMIDIARYLHSEHDLMIGIARELHSDRDLVWQTAAPPVGLGWQQIASEPQLKHAGKRGCHKMEHISPSLCERSQNECTLRLSLSETSDISGMHSVGNGAVF